MAQNIDFNDPKVAAVADVLRKRYRAEAEEAMRKSRLEGVLIGAKRSLDTAKAEVLKFAASQDQVGFTLCPATAPIPPPS